jgi:hypothetical protein
MKYITLLLAFTSTALAQPPVITTVVNGASLLFWQNLGPLQPDRFHRNEANTRLTELTRDWRWRS